MYRLVILDLVILDLVILVHILDLVILDPVILVLAIVLVVQAVFKRLVLVNYQEFIIKILILITILEISFIWFNYQHIQNYFYILFF
jgi:hypothetical protein